MKGRFRGKIVRKCVTVLHTDIIFSIFEKDASALKSSSQNTPNLTPGDSTTGENATTRNSLCDEKLIPENVVPDIVELLVTLGLIQQEATADPSVPRFAVHFGKPKQFLVTPTNILSEISKAQSEIQASRQRQEMLKEALSLPDRQAAEKVKHIVLQHPQVVDDPVYVTALRNLQVDGMLIAGTASGINNNAPGNSTASPSLPNKGSSGTSKSTGAPSKKSGGLKQPQTDGNPSKRKRQRSKKEGPPDTDVSGNKAVPPPAKRPTTIPTTTQEVPAVTGSSIASASQATKSSVADPLPAVDALKK